MTMWPWRRRSDEDFAEELRAHIAQETSRFVEEEGLNVQSAKARALRSFGNVTGAQERFYERGRLIWVDDIRRDLAGALRNLRRNPGFASIAIVTIGLESVQMRRSSASSTLSCSSHFLTFSPIGLYVSTK